MENKNALVQLMFDYHKGHTVDGISLDEANEKIRQKLIEFNGGSTKLDIKALRRNPQMFDIIETLIDRTISEGLQENDWFTTLCEVRNLAEGDSADFVIKNPGDFIVSDIARGTQALRRQRLTGETSINIKPTPHGVKVYDELTRILAGRADVNDLIDNTSKAMQRQMLDDQFAAFNSLTANQIGGSTYYEKGSYVENTMFNLANHVSAANFGSDVVLITTKAGARKIGATTVSGELVKNDYYNFGYPQMWNGFKVLALPQRHKVGTDEFIFDDNKIHLIATNDNDKLIKQVIGGESLLIVGDPTTNADLTQDITLINQFATGVIAGAKKGLYEISA